MLGRGSWLGFIALAGATIVTSPAAAQRCIAASDMADDAANDRYCGVPLITTMLDGSTPLGGTAGFGSNSSCLGQNDDGSGPMINIDPYFPMGLHFFSATHHSIYVNTNGNITMSGPVSQYTPAPFPVSTNPMIAPFWADVDIRNADGSCTEAMGTTCTNCSPCQPFAANGVWWAFEPGRAVFTWDEVGYYTCHDDRRMSFQLVLTAAPTTACGGAGDFDVEFRYNRCEWETGDASGGTGGFAPAGTSTMDMSARCINLLGMRICPLGSFPCTGSPSMCTAPAGSSSGTPAQAGFDAGNRMNFVEIMNSRMTHAIGRTLCQDSNVGMPGIWRFQIRSGGVICPDAGAPCPVPGQMGVCAMGRTNCVGSGTECVQQVFPAAETCDNIDNDCNGMVDDGASLCSPGFVCRSGSCVANCFESSCGAPLVCAPSGVCVEAGCETMSCPAGQRCTAGGACVGACDGVVCPDGASCVEGRCVDACTGLTCDDCTVCDAGACVLRCTMGGTCGTGQECQASTGACVEAGCGTTSCPAGQHCASGGTCVDSCAGVTCPIGQMCTAGACVAVPVPDAGMVMGRDAAIILPDSGMPPVDAGTSGGMDASSVGDDAGRAPARRSSGCGCDVGRASERPLGLALFIGLAALVRRRRGRS